MLEQREKNPDRMAYLRQLPQWGFIQEVEVRTSAIHIFFVATRFPPPVLRPLHDHPIAPPYFVARTLLRDFPPAPAGPPAQAFLESGRRVANETRDAVERATAEVLDSAAPDLGEILSHVGASSAGGDQRWHFWSR